MGNKFGGPKNCLESHENVPKNFRWCLWAAERRVNHAQHPGARTPIGASGNFLLVEDTEQEKTHPILNYQQDNISQHPLAAAWAVTLVHILVACSRVSGFF